MKKSDRKCRTILLELKDGTLFASDEEFVGEECEKLIELFGEAFGEVYSTYTPDHDKRRPGAPHVNKNNNNNNTNTN